MRCFCFVFLFCLFFFFLSFFLSFFLFVVFLSFFLFFFLIDRCKTTQPCGFTVHSDWDRREKENTKNEGKRKEGRKTEGRENTDVVKKAEHCVYSTQSIFMHSGTPTLRTRTIREGGGG